MARPIIDLTGQKFGRLTVQCLDEVRSKNAYWICNCSCGTKTTTRASHLKSGTVKSCGCLRASCDRLSNIPEYDVWKQARYRCSDKKHKRYKNYGARGIKVCQRWQKSFLNFLNDMGPRPSPDHSIDRIDNDGDYEPSNCRWATREQQHANQNHRNKYSPPI